MRGFASKQREIEARLARYFDKVSECVAAMDDTLRDYCAEEDEGRLGENMRLVSGIESEADDIRREIELLMYTKALFPESRGDILGLLETLDKVPNQAEAVIRKVKTQHIGVPEEFRDGLLEMSALGKRCVTVLLEGARRVFSDYANAAEKLGMVDEIESQADYVEEMLTEKIFLSDLTGFDKLVLKDLVGHLGSVCDRAENAGDRIRIMVAKRGF